MRPLLSPAIEQQVALPLAKEYVYAGGRLVAIEEPTPIPTPTPAGPAPTNLKAVGTSASGVHLEWDAAAGAISYVVERRNALGAQSVETQTGSASPAFEDAVPPGDNAYLYRVKAVYANGHSPYGNYDLATTVPFTDDAPLRGIVIQAAHLTQLRRAVRAVRILAGRGEPTWSHPDPVSSPASERRVVYLSDVTELRAQVDEALRAIDAALGVQTFYKQYPAEPALEEHGTIYAAHFEQIRERVR
jgi:hypothetical protein